jgi:uncharacterized protein (TIRG00374 family)
MKILKKYSFLIGLIILFFVLNRVDFDQLWQIIRRTNSKLLILAVLFNPVMLFVKSVCWNYLKRKQGIRYSITDSFLMLSAGIAIGNLTPGRLGEVINLAYLKKDGHPLSKSLLTIVLDRLSDSIVLVLLGYFGLLVLFGSFYKITFYFILMFMIPVALAVALKNQATRHILKKAFIFIVPQKHQEHLKINFNDFIGGFKKYQPKDWLVVFLITVSAWLVYYIQMFILARSIGIDSISFLYLAIIVTIVGLATLLPISIFGLGTREGLLVVFFSFFSISQEMAISFSALVLLTSLTAVAFGCFCLLIKPISLKDFKNRTTDFHSSESH